VLEEHPIDLTFFFVPQVVQALRYDALGMFSQFVLSEKAQSGVGYVSQFILETANVSQLFCHQIIWNMKANCYKDDAAEIVSTFRKWPAHT
jgi:phosphatidylinositol 4-kinase